MKCEMDYETFFERLLHPFRFIVHDHKDKLICFRLDLRSVIRTQECVTEIYFLMFLYIVIIV